MIETRLLELRKLLGYKSVTAFSEHLGVKRPTLASYEAGTYPPSAEFLTILYDKDNVNINWLLTGKGSMLHSTKELRDCQKSDNSEKVREALAEFQASLPQRNNEFKGVPYYDVEATAHIAEALNHENGAPEFYVDFQPFNDCTAYLPVYGNSMFPAIQSGEVIAVKEVKNFNVILWGEMYLVVANADQNDLRAVKTLHQHEDEAKIILRSSNPNFKGDTVIPKESILKLYIVKGKISRSHL